MEKLPAFMFYGADWVRDPIAGCSLAAQGLWLRMMILMHFSERYGYLCVNGEPMQPDSIVAMCGARSLAEYTTLLAELDKNGIPSRTQTGIIFSRRMVRDARKRLMARRNGKKGGNPILKNVVNPQVNPSLNMKMNIGSSNGDGCREGERSPSAQKAYERALARAHRKGVKR